MPLTVSEQHDLVAKERLVTIALTKDLSLLLKDKKVIIELGDTLVRLPFFKKTLPVVQNKIGIVTDLDYTENDVSRLLRAVVAAGFCEQLFSELRDSPLWYEGADAFTCEVWKRYRINEGSTLYDVKDLLYKLMKRKSKDSVGMALEICLGEYIHRDSRAYPGSLQNVLDLELPSERLLELLIMRRILEEAEK